VFSFAGGGPFTDELNVFQLPPMPNESMSFIAIFFLFYIPIDVAIVFGLFLMPFLSMALLHFWKFPRHFAENHSNTVICTTQLLFAVIERGIDVLETVCVMY